MVQIHTEIRHNYQWIWHNELIWNHFFPELRTMKCGVINIHILWRPMSLLESGMWKPWKSSVANQHGMKCVKCAWLIIWACKNQNNMGTGWGEYSLSVPYAIWGNIVWHISKLVHKVFLKAIDCTVVGWNRRCKIRRWKCRWKI